MTDFSTTTNKELIRKIARPLSKITNSDYTAIIEEHDAEWEELIRRLGDDLAGHSIHKAKENIRLKKKTFDDSFDGLPEYDLTT